MMGHNICFEGVIWKIIPKLSVLPLLMWSTDKTGRQKKKKNGRAASPEGLSIHLNVIDGTEIRTPSLTGTV